MSRRASRPSAVRFGGPYHDRIPLEEDFETVTARTVSLSGPNGLPTTAHRSSVSSSWTVGDAWAPEDDDEFSLDPDHGWYDEAVEADVGELLDEVVSPLRRHRKKCTQTSVRSNLVVQILYILKSIIILS